MHDGQRDTLHQSRPSAQPKERSLRPQEVGKCVMFGSLLSLLVDLSSQLALGPPPAAFCGIDSHSDKEAALAVQ